MADFFVPNTAGALRGLAAGLNQQRQQQQAQANLQQQMQFQQQQAAIQNQAAADRATRQESMDTFNKQIGIFNLLKDAGASPIARKKFLNENIIPLTDGLMKEIPIDDTEDKIGEIITRLHASRIKLVKGGASEDEATEAFGLAMKAMAQEFPESEPLKEEVKEIRGIEKERRMVAQAKELATFEAGFKEQKETKPVFKLFKGKNKLQFLDINKPIPKGMRPFIKQPPGKPFKRGQMMLFKDVGDGQPPEVKVLSSIDGNVNVKKFEEAVANGFMTESMLRRQQPSLAQEIVQGLREASDSPISNQDRAAQNGKNAGRKERFDEFRKANPNASDKTINDMLDFEEKAKSIK
jgi:hypothetical protein